MIEKFSKWLSTWLIQNGGDSTQRNVYAYGVECLTNELISDFLLLFFGLLLNKTIYIILSCISFTAVRLFLGGYHASTHARCILTGTVTGICSLYLNPIFAIISISAETSKPRRHKPPGSFYKFIMITNYNKLPV